VSNRISTFSLWYLCFRLIIEHQHRLEADVKELNAIRRELDAGCCIKGDGYQRRWTLYEDSGSYTKGIGHCTKETGRCTKEKELKGTLIRT
jgi:hypothetical protein